MTAEGAVVELVERVRASATGPEPAALRAALERELGRLGRQVRAHPSRWGAWADGVDVVGTAYERLVKADQRRAAGQFQTPPWAAQLMATWLTEEPIELLLDPGVGSGRLLLAAAAQPRPPQRMLGLDSDPVALAMTRLNAKLRRLENLSLRCGDFLLDAVPAAPTAITANPPFSRHHAIPAPAKAAIHAGLEERGLKVSRLAPLHVLFLLRALDVVAEGGRLAVLTPSWWLDANYGRQIKHHVRNQARVDGLVFFDESHSFFAGAKTTALITLLTKGAKPAATAPAVQLGAELPAVSEVLRALCGRSTSLTVEEAELTEARSWGRPPTPRRQGQPLAALGRVRRGVATGCKPFFVLSEAARREYGLRKADLRPCLANPRYISGLEVSSADLAALPEGAPRWILDRREPEAEHADDAYGRYLRVGRAHGADDSHLAQHRTPWYALEQRGPSPIIFTYFNVDRPRFIRNRAGAVPLNTFLIIEPADGVDADALWAALQRPSFMAQLAHARRPYGDGMWKLERHELELLRVRL